MRSRTNWIIAGVVCGMFVISGCGDGLGLKPTTGTVTYKGAPVEGANVTFVAESGPIGTGTTDASGKFTITTNGKPGAVVGKHGVMISKTSSNIEGMPANPTPEDMMKMGAKMGAKAGAISKDELPSKFGTTQGSGLTADVTADGENNFPFDLGS
jgi:hypothetical protein